MTMPGMTRRKLVELSQILNVLGNLRRMQVLMLLRERGEMTVNEIAGTMGLSQSALSQHLAKLRYARLVHTRREAQKRHYSLGSVSALQFLDSLMLLEAEKDHVHRPEDKYY